MATSKLTELEERLKRLEIEHKQLRSRQEWVERVFESYGVKGLWLSPVQASPLLGVSCDRIEDEIRLAEELRIIDKKGDALYGIHYRNVQNVKKKRATWQVNIAKFDELFRIPPDKRKI